MAQYMNSNFELAGPLAGLFGGIQQGQQEESTRLQNVYQDLLNQQKGVELPAKAAQAQLDEALATGKLEGGYAPEAVKAAVGEKAVQAQEFDLQKGMNNIELARTALDAGVAPEQLMTQYGIDPDSAVGKAFTKDPHKTLDTLYDNMVKRRANTVKQAQTMQQLEQKGENVLDQIAARAKTSGGGAGDKYKYNRVAIEQRALAGDVDAQRQVNLWAAQKAQSQAGGIAIVQRPDGSLGLGQKGDTLKLPFPDVGVGQQAGTAPQPTGTRPPLSSFNK